MEFGQKLKEARTKVGLTQETVAKELGVTRQTMSNWENDRSYPDLASVLKLSELYGISVDEMLKEDGSLRKKMQERQENIKRHCSWVHDFGILLMPVAMVLAYFNRTGPAIFTAILGFLIFCLPHFVYVRQFGAPGKWILLRVLAAGAWLSGVMISRIQGEFDAGQLLVFGGLLLQSFVNHKLKDCTGMISKRMTAFSGFVIALVVVFAMIPVASESIEKGSYNEANPFNSRAYRVTEVLQGENEKIPLVKLWKGNTGYVQYPGEEELRLEGTFTHVTQPDNSPYKGVWELIPEDDVQKRYKVVVDGDGQVVFACEEKDATLWAYSLEYAPMMGVQIMDSLGLITGAAQWFYDDFLESPETVGSLPLRGKGELRLSIPGSPDSIAVYEEYHRDGKVSYREFTLERNRKDRYVMKLEANKEADKEFYIFRIPHEDGEFVMKLGMQP